MEKNHLLIFPAKIWPNHTKGLWGLLISYFFSQSVLYFGFMMSHEVYMNNSNKMFSM